MSPDGPSAPPLFRGKMDAGFATVGRNGAKIERPLYETHMAALTGFEAGGEKREASAYIGKMRAQGPNGHTKLRRKGIGVVPSEPVTGSPALSS